MVHPMRSMLVLLVALSGCAHLTPECATHGAGPWREWTSAHFKVRSNLPAADAQAATVQLERARAALLPAFPSGPTERAPLEVVLFENAAQLHDVTGDASLDVTFTHDWAGPVLALSPTGSVFESSPQLRALLHELAHWFSAQSLRRAPRWFTEGLAHYLETTTLDDRAQTARRGRANQERLDEVLRWGILPVTSLWAWDVAQDQRPGLEQHRAASAWFWVHFLCNEQRPALTKFMEALAAGRAPRDAWSAAFAHLGPEAMSAAAQAYLAKGQVRTQHLELGQLNVAMTERVVSDAEVHATLARVAAASGAWARAGSEAQVATSLDPANPRALEQHVVTAATPEARLEAARQLTQAWPQLPAGWLLLALALPPAEPERVTALEQALALDPDSFLALSELAQRRCAAGQCREAVSLAEKAARLAPEDVRVWASYATVLAKAGQCAEAVSVKERAREVLGHRAKAAPVPLASCEGS